MKYMLVLIGEDGGWEDATPEQMKEEMDRWSEFGQKLVDAGAFIAGEGLQEGATATTVRIGERGERVVTDGPFAETKEQLGGFFLIEASDQQEAIHVAARWPSASIGSIEVRPIEEELRMEGRYREVT
jgi:hypothetical protein